jgi:uncharacterized protein YutE (UPF0331/DUF86 family)
MIDALYQNECISRELRDMLMEINKLRNLIFHGHMDRVNEGVMRSLQEAQTRWKKKASDIN